MKLITLNIERHKHYEKILAFLQKEDADVLCMQEVTDEFAVMVEELGYNVHYTKTHLYDDGERSVIEGLLIASKKPLKNIQRLYYNKTKEALPFADNEHYWETNPFLCLFATVDGMRIGTTHFPVGENGGIASVHQERAIKPLENILTNLPPHILCGDFNTPRGINSIYDHFIKIYKDNIPAKYSSSIDKNLHRLGNDPEKQFIFTEHMVDHIFTQAPYRVENVRLEFGVSDHAAVVADVFNT